MSEFSPKGVAGFDPHSSNTFNYHDFQAADPARLRTAHNPPHDLASMTAVMDHGTAGAPRSIRDARLLSDHGHGRGSVQGTPVATDDFVESLPEPPDDAAASYRQLLDSLRKPDGGRSPRRAPRKTASPSANNAGKGGGAVVVFVVFVIAAIVIANVSSGGKSKPPRNNRAAQVSEFTRDLRAWQAVDTNSADSIREYLDEFPLGDHSAEARRQLAAIDELAEVEKLARSEGTSAADVQAMIARSRSNPAVRQRLVELLQYIVVRDQGARSLSAWLRGNASSPFASLARERIDAELVRRLPELAAATESSARFTYALPGEATMVNMPVDADASLTVQLKPRLSASIVEWASPLSRIPGWLPVRMTTPSIPLINVQANSPLDARVVIFRRVAASATNASRRGKGIRLQVTVSWHAVDAVDNKSLGIWTQTFETPDEIQPTDNGNRYWRDSHNERQPYERLDLDGTPVWVPDFMTREQTVARGLVIGH